MYKINPEVRADPKRRWHLPDRIFFGHGACHILAGVYLRQRPVAGFYAERVIPGNGFAGNHVYVTDGTIAFDYHGYCSRLKLLNYHTKGWASRYNQGWNCTLERVDFDLLDTRELNNRKMLGPDQYYGDAILRARVFIERIDHAGAVRKALHALRASTSPHRAWME